MTRFTDGPADGVSLLLRRAPIFLRAVHSTEGGWDALDLLGEAPAAGELIHVYRRFGSTGRVHIRACARGDRKGKAMSKSQGGFFVRADYRYYATQPGDTVRTQTEWENWCLQIIEAERKAAAS